MRLFRLAGIAVVAFLLGVALLAILPDRVKYGITDSVLRLGAPDLNISLDSLSASSKSDVISRYRNMGLNLRCYNDLRPEEKIGRFNDSLCWALIKTAFGDISARQVAFFFYRNKLALVRIEFPVSSSSEVLEYLSANLGDRSRLDDLSGKKFGFDEYGRPLNVWKVKNGLVTTSAADDSAPNVIILWTSSDILLLEALRSRFGS